MTSKGYVALFSEPLKRGHLETIIGIWLRGYTKVEQVCPGPQAGTTTMEIRAVGDVLWEKNLQFRVLNDVTFTWVYVSQESRVLETSGLPEEGNILPLDILLDLPGIEEVIDQENDRRLDELEAEGLM